jgi:hypothetical protein
VSPQVATKDLDAYNESLAKSLEDKRWFLPHVRKDIGLWVDFGCADGTLLRSLPDGVLKLAYDIDPRQVQRAIQKGLAGTWEWANVEEAVRQAKRRGLKVGIHFSSVLDEVKGLTKLVEEVNALKPDAIVIRQHAVDQWAQWKDAPKEWLSAILHVTHPTDLLDFVERYGYVETRKQALQFFLKAPYLGTVDYKRELESDYLGIDAQDYLTMFGAMYRVAYSRHDKGNGYIQRFAYTKFGVYLPDNTHVKIVLERK